MVVSPVLLFHDYDSSEILGFRPGLIIFLSPSHSSIIFFCSNQSMIIFLQIYQSLIIFFQNRVAPPPGIKWSMPYYQIVQAGITVLIFNQY